MPYFNTDIPELRGFDTGQVLENLALLYTRQRPWMEATIAELAELAFAVIQDAENDPDTLQSILLSLEDYAEITPRQSDHTDSFYLCGMEKSIGLYQKLLLYHFICKALGDLPQIQGQARQDMPPSAKGRIAYMNSALVGKAYMKFASVIEGCRAADFHSFAEACEEVQGGLCEYCILPLHSSTDGQLMSFYRLILKYRLQIVATHEINHKVGGQPATTTFGLLRRMGEDWDIRDNFLTPLLSHDPDAPLILSILYIPEPQLSFGDILTASEYCGVPLIETSTIPYSEVSALLYGYESENATETSANAFTLTFRMGKISTLTSISDTTMPQAFLTHLILETSEHLILGLYPQL